MIPSAMTTGGWGAWRGRVGCSSWRQGRPALLGLLLLAARLAGAQADEAEPPRPAEPVLVWGFEASGTYGSSDPGYFNDFDYGHEYGWNGYRLGVLAGQVQIRFAPRTALLAEVRSANLEAPWVHALFVRSRPFARVPLDVQLGRMPSVFGAYPRRRYMADNPLIGQPLVYQYLTSLRPDAMPASADGFRAMRGAGWRPFYVVGSRETRTGLPMANAFLRDTGIGLRIGDGPVELALALTQGSLGSPRVSDDNSGKQLVGRLRWRPSFGLVLGASAAHGEYLDAALEPALPEAARAASYSQTALGLDVEYGMGRWLWRAEAVFSRWDVPAISAPVPESPLRTWAAFAEVRCRLGPGLYAAGRADHVSFAEITGRDGPFTWDAPIDRMEVALGFAPWRRVLVKAAYQYNWRDGGRVHEKGLVGAQVSVWY
jgi:hypothetical protein